MSQSEPSPKVGLEAVGLTNLGGVMWNPTAATLYEEFIMNGEGVIAANGPMCGETGKYTGRSPEDKFLVEEASSKDKIAWGKVNKPFSEEKYNHWRWFWNFGGGAMTDLFSHWIDVVRLSRGMYVMLARIGLKRLGLVRSAG